MGYLASLGDPFFQVYPKPFKRVKYSISLFCFFIFVAKLKQALFDSSNAKACHFHDRLRDSDWIRTNDLLLRRQLLYPAELPNQELPIGGAK
jgi:hypothetical protein